MRFKSVGENDKTVSWELLNDNVEAVEAGPEFG